MTDAADINKIFDIVDSDGSGYLDREKLRRICPNLSPTEIDVIFDDLDTNRDNRISLKEFTSGFKSLISPTQLESSISKKSKHILDVDENLTSDMTPVQINEIFTSLSCQEQIYDFYETLRSKSTESTEQFQSILEVFVGDILKYRKEIKRLEDSYRREKEMNENFLKRLEEDQEREIRQVEDKIRKEAQMKFEAERDVIQQRAAKQIVDLQANVQRLQAIEQSYRDRQSTEDSLAVVLREEISKLTQENQTLNSSYNDSLTTIAILKSDLQSLKAQLNEKQTMLQQEKQSALIIHREKESLQSNVRQLVEVNNKLRDENDTLREMIDSSKPTSELALTSKRSASRAGSILENYWSSGHHPRADCMSPSYGSTLAQQIHIGTVNSFDLESADELGILGNKFPSKPNSVITDISSQKVLTAAAAAATLPPLIHDDHHNTMNDSGLSLTTVRDITELESDRDSKMNGSVILRNSKAYRSMPMRRNHHDSDSDDVFAENSFERSNSKRWSQQHRSSKRSSFHHRLSSKQSSQSSSFPMNVLSSKKSLESPATLAEPTTTNLPFDRMYKVVFCGDAAVGKSTLIMRLCKGKFISNVNSTLGVDFQNKQLDLDGKRIAIQLWDTAGQERFRSIAKSYFRRCDGVILVYDSTYERSFLNVREWIDTINESAPKKVSVMIIANKIDLREQFRSEGKRVIEHADGAKLAKEYQAMFIETSAKDGTNTNEALIELARDMQCNEDVEIDRMPGINLDKTTKKSACCGRS